MVKGDDNLERHLPVGDEQGRDHSRQLLQRVDRLTTPVAGSLDKKNQRVAWTIGDKKFPVYEAGLYQPDEA